MTIVEITGGMLRAARGVVDLAERAGLCCHSMRKWETSSHAIPAAMYAHLCRAVDILEDLAKARAYEFAFVMQPLKLDGSAGVARAWPRISSGAGCAAAGALAALALAFGSLLQCQRAPRRPILPLRDTPHATAASGFQ